jgi:sigma-B regulation protein RsbU (phosphoserine phosphatase)
MKPPRLSVADVRGKRDVTIDHAPFTIGRREAAHLPIVGSDISRDHAEIDIANGTYVIRDVGSRFGTFLNGTAVTSPQPLAHGDRIRLGTRHDVELTFLLHTDETQSLLSRGTAASDFQQMAAILNGLRALGSGRVLDEVLTLVLDSAVDATTAERGFIMLADATGALQFRAARGRGRHSLAGTSFTTSEKIPRRVFDSGKSVMVSDLLESSLAGVHDGTVALGIRHILCVPLTVSTYAANATACDVRTIGVLYLDGRERGTLLAAHTQSSLEAFATQAALAIDSARLYADAAEKARLERDLQIAAEIQRALLPPPSAAGKYYSLAASSLPCRTIGGDFFDYIDLAERGLGVVLGDVSGKGPPAALLAATVQSHFAALCPISSSPADTVSAMNRAILRRAVEARFTTMFHAVLLPDGTLSYCNAGHEPPLVVRCDGRVDDLPTNGTVVGLFAHAVYETAVTKLAPGDVVVVVSDGVTESQNTAGEDYGRDRLRARLESLGGRDPQFVLEAVTESVTAFAGVAPQADDLTVLVLGSH